MALAHHAFTRPHDECVAMLESDPGKVLCYRYDLVLNGVELGGDRFACTTRRCREGISSARHFGDEEARTKFGFLL